eukprot:1339606-Amphidinium_carterae.1
MRAAAAGQEVIITTTLSDYFNFEIAVKLIGSILLDNVGITTIVIAVCTSMRLHQKPQMRDVSTQTDQGDATRVAER